MDLFIGALEKMNNIGMRRDGFVFKFVLKNTGKFVRARLLSLRLPKQLLHNNLSLVLILVNLESRMNTCSHKLVQKAQAKEKQVERRNFLFTKPAGICF